jgi:hypothetical protein
MEGDYDFKKMEQEIEDLDIRAREYEDWLLENINDPEYFKIKNKYDDMLFRINQKKMKIESIKTGYRPPDTLNISSALRIKR